MNNYNKKRPLKPAIRISREQQISKAKADCEAKMEEIAKEKNTIDYGDLTWDAFITISLDETYDTVTASRIIDLQNRYKELRAEHELIYAEDIVIAELNQKHAVVHVDQTYILTEKENIFGGHDFSLESSNSFKMYYLDQKIMCFDGKEQRKADIWLNSPKRRKYSNIVFDPSGKFDKKYYNIWRGFARSAKQGDCLKYWNHVFEIICNDDKETYTYLRKWLAYVFQRPDVVHTAVVLCGLQGVGKNTFVDPLGVLLGSHYAPLSNISELISNFNFHLKNAVLIHANEALWGGHKKDIGTIKAMITERMCLIEGKGKDRIVVPNFKHIILSSNEDWPVHLDPDDRRFLVLNVSDKRKEDKAYFGAIHHEMENGGYEALLYDLLNEDISNYDPRTLPSNSNSFDIKMRSVGSAHRYLYEALSAGGFSIGKDESTHNQVWHNPVSKKKLYEDYAKWCDDNHETTETNHVFSKYLKRLIVSVKDVRPSSGGTRVRSYEFSTLARTQEDFAKTFKEEPSRIFANYVPDYELNVHDSECEVDQNK
ncbi:MAG: DUF5906 domain-containing protein [Candidatus Dependentiae bacterium]|nr:DUF5906 domain-containing protein [Candidatus Dependentiae bacterium]